MLCRESRVVFIFGLSLHGHIGRGVIAIRAIQWRLLGIAAVAVIQREEVGCRGVRVSSRDVDGPKISAPISHCVGVTMAAPVIQLRQKRETGRSDGLPGGSLSDGREEIQSSNTCQALNRDEG